MKNLLYKELKLSMGPQAVIFYIFSIVNMLVPNYSRYFAFFYCTIGALMIFINSSNNNDFLFTATLPIKKKDVVKARFLFIGLYEFSSLLFSIPPALFTNYITGGVNPSRGINASVAFYGILLFISGITNFVMLSLCFRKAVSKYILEFLIVFSLYMTLFGLAEVPVWQGTEAGKFITSLEKGMLLKQLPLLGIGLAVWLTGFFASFPIAVRQFEKVDL